MRFNHYNIDNYSRMRYSIFVQKVKNPQIFYKGQGDIICTWMITSAGWQPIWKTPL